MVLYLAICNVLPIFLVSFDLISFGYLPGTVCLAYKAANVLHSIVPLQGPKFACVPKNDAATVPNCKRLIFLAFFSSHFRHSIIFWPTFSSISPETCTHGGRASGSKILWRVQKIGRKALLINLIATIMPVQNPELLGQKFVPAARIVPISKSPELLAKLAWHGACRAIGDTLCHASQKTLRELLPWQI